MDERAYLAYSNQRRGEIIRELTNDELARVVARARRQAVVQPESTFQKPTFTRLMTRLRQLVGRWKVRRHPVRWVAVADKGCGVSEVETCV